MMLPSIDFESIASTNSATWAKQTALLCPQSVLGIFDANSASRRSGAYFYIYTLLNFYVKINSCPIYIQIQFFGLIPTKSNRIHINPGETLMKCVSLTWRIP